MCYKVINKGKRKCRLQVKLLVKDHSLLRKDNAKHFVGLIFEYYYIYQVTILNYGIKVDEDVQFVETSDNAFAQEPN